MSYAKRSTRVRNLLQSMDDSPKGGRILVGCEFSGTIRRALRSYGHDAWSCDLLPSDDNSPFHIVGDVRSLLADGWSGAIFHPPCTFLCQSGVRWLYHPDGSDNIDRWTAMWNAASFFLDLLESPIPVVAVENPVMHPHAARLIFERPFCKVQPYQFGHAVSKGTCFWGRGLPPLLPVSVDAPGKDLHNASPGPNRWRIRSKTFDGIADAIAAQWGSTLASSTRLSSTGVQKPKSKNQRDPNRLFSSQLRMFS